MVQKWKQYWIKWEEEFGIALGKLGSCAGIEVVLVLLSSFEECSALETSNKKCLVLSGANIREAIISLWCH